MASRSKEIPRECVDMPFYHQVLVQKPSIQEPVLKSYITLMSLSAINITLCLVTREEVIKCFKIIINITCFMSDPLNSEYMTSTPGMGLVR